MAASRRVPTGAASAALLLLAVAPRAAAQSVATSVGAQVIGLYTHSDLVPGGGTADEVRVIQPVIMLHAAFGGRRLVGLATADLEGLTIPNGELAPGAWGEGLWIAVTPTPTPMSSCCRPMTCSAVSMAVASCR